MGHSAHPCGNVLRRKLLFGLHLLVTGTLCEILGSKGVAGAFENASGFSASAASNVSAASNGTFASARVRLAGPSVDPFTAAKQTILVK